MVQIYVNIYLLFNVCYNILIIMILKWGSSNILWLAMTVMVPLGNLAFALPFMPGATPVTAFDLVGLVVIMVGLMAYRLGPDLWNKHCLPPPPDPLSLQEESIDRKEPLIRSSSPGRGGSTH